MNWERKINFFVLVPIITALAGNLSLGLIVAGLTGLIWGIGPGSLFISMTTSILLIMTGNINMELIFLFTLSLAYLVQGGYIPGLDNRDRGYYFMTLFSLLLTPIWRLVLGYIPVSLLNELNVAGGLLVIAGLIIFVVRFRLLIENNGSKEKIFESLLGFICSLTGLMGSIFTIPLWIGGSYLLTVFAKNQWKFKSFLFQKERLYSILSVVLFLMIAYAASLILPYGFFTGLLIFSILFLFFRRAREVPTVELVYFSMILGILASRMGILL